MRRMRRRRGKNQRMNVDLSKEKTGCAAVTPFFCALLTVLFLCRPNVVSAGAVAGLSVCANALIPALFPFLCMTPLFSDALSRILPRGNRRALLTGVFLIGMTAGFPAGTVLLCAFVQRGALDRTTAARLLGITTTASPAFLIGYVGNSLFHSTALGVLLWLIPTVLSGFRFLMILRTLPKTDIATPPSLNAPTLASSVREAVVNVLSLSGFVVFFSVIRAFVATVLPALPATVLGGFLEMTGGIATLADLYECGGISDVTAACLGCAMLSFGGVCVGMQVAGFANAEQIPMHCYFRQKMITALLSTVILFVLLLISFSSV